MEHMNILGIYGSMRVKGNSDWMLNTLLASAENNGAQVDRVLLRKLKIKFCVGCDKCAEKGECAINDDMQKIYPELLNADVIVVGCPNYFKNVSALTKNFIDRTNAFVRFERKLKGKFAVGLCVGGEELEDTTHCSEALLRFFKGHRMKTIAIVKARADKKGEISNNIDLEKKLMDMGEKIARNDPEVMKSFLWEYNIHGSHNL